MDARRAQDLLKHICQDEDYGLGLLEKLPLPEVIYVVNVILPQCLKEADDKANIYIRPFKDKCDIIISGEGPRPRYKELMEKVLKFILKQKECTHGFKKLTTCYQ